MSSEVFIIGCARSGTTILTDIINTSDDVCILGEANFHYRWTLPDFVYSFNSQHRQSGRLASRSTYLPKDWIGLSACQVLEELRKTFPVVGSKIAFPPFREHSDGWTQDATLNFQMQHFYGARYIFSLREPVASCLSAAKLFPTASPNGILASWLRSLAFQVLGAQIFPRHWFIPQEWIDSTIFPKLEALLGVRFAATPDWLSDARTASGRPDSGPGGDFADSLVLAPGAVMTGREILKAALELYEEVVGWLDRESMRFRLPGATVDVLELRVVENIRNLVAQLAPDDSAAPRNLLTAPDNLLDRAWVRGAVSAECSIRGDGREMSVFLVREQEGASHKNLTQAIALPAGQVLEFSIEVKPQPCSRAALQVGHAGGPSLAGFDFVAHKPLFMHQGPGILVLDTNCRLQPSGWICCSLSFKLTQGADPLHFSFYLLGDNGEFEYSGNPARGLLLRNPKVAQIQWPIIE